jgi:hypothetical protein
MSMAELVAAGAPELPEGWFYRVADTHTVGLKVEIREQRKRFGSRELSSMYVYEERHSDPLSAVVEACTRAYTLVQDQDIARARFDALLPFIGDHDPKGGR